MRKIVIMRMLDPATTFKISDLSTLMRLRGDPDLVEYLEDNILEASLHELAKYGPLLQLELDCKYYGRRPTGKMEVGRPKVRQKADVWVRSGWKLALGVDLPRSLSRLVAALLSAGFHGRPKWVESLEFDRERFEKLIKGVEERGGRLVSFHLLGAPPYRVLQASASSAGIKEEDKKMIETCSKIKRLGFHLHLGEDFYSFWIADGGNGTLYQPALPQPHHIGKLLEFLEEKVVNS